MLSRRKPARCDEPILPVLQERWSARAFDDSEIDTAVLQRLFEAARWSPSSLNEQPWRFVIARRRDREPFAAFLAALSPGNQAWAGRAAVLGFALAIRTNQRTGGANRWSWYDTGQAIAHLSVQATHEGVIVHQLAGFDSQIARIACSAPPELELVVAFALGFPGDPATLDDYNHKKELAQRARRPLKDSLFEGRWGQVLKHDIETSAGPGVSGVV